ncbi:tigger transposable element-derived protein 1-like [Macrobrachium rosenbergii]|uniref:tigger transposable element-derived protein 1-like n=1 Tax=Macrobrachium rosenbergii TaxID=79674 RepID=UPI0034D4FBF1
MKRKIIEKHKQGVRVMDLCRQHGGAASSNVKAAEEFVKHFAKLIEAEGYVPQQVSNCDETGLFWRKILKRTYMMAEEKSMPGHKPMKDRLTLVLCASVSGDCKVKPLIVYHSENPRAFNTLKVTNENLQDMWRANPKAWVTRDIFVQWVNMFIGPANKKYLTENNLPLRALLVLDDVPAHLPNLANNILEEFKL